MNPEITGLRVTGIVFGLMALAQFTRLVIHAKLFVAADQMPLLPRMLAFIILGALSVWMWTLARTSTK